MEEEEEGRFAWKMMSMEAVGEGDWEGMVEEEEGEEAMERGAPRLEQAREERKRRRGRGEGESEIALILPSFFYALLSLFVFILFIIFFYASIFL